MTDRSVPTDWKDPRWDQCQRIHDWKNYISDEIAEMWDSFTDVQKQALAQQAESSASREDWE